jgi:uncharacterized repeat protein (TIGR01451 family)
LLIGAVLIGSFAAATPVRVAANHDVDLTAKIFYVKVLDDGLEGTGRGEADLYAGFAIGTSAFRDCGTFGSHGHGQTEIRPNDWVCTTRIEINDDTLPGFANVDLQVWDHDDCDDPFCTNTGELESNDDQADISPGGTDTLALTVDLSNGRWTSAGSTTDADWPRNCAEGSGDTAVKICFDISIDSPTGDADGDGLLDGWERNGYNADGDATIDVDLPTMGTQPQRKDLLLELDCLVAGPGHSHCPQQAAVQDVVQAFANGQVGNPDGSSGIELHVDVGNIYGQALNATVNVPRTPGGAATGTFGNYGSTTQIPEAGLTVLDFDGGSDGVDIGTVRAANMDSKRFQVMRYGLFGHQTNARKALNDCTSGLAFQDVFMVTLGGVGRAGTPPGPCWTVPAGGTQGLGDQDEQAGTFLHEFGHTLGLGHGGGESIYNNKPNYLSVMNYSYQQCNVPAYALIDTPGGCDLSRIDLDDLDENSLDECKGLGNGLPRVNWNGDGNFSGPFYDGTTCPAPSGANVKVNINDDTTDDADGDGNQSGSEPDFFSTLEGYDDWANLQYRLQANGGGAGAVAGFVEATPEMIEHAEALVAEYFRPAPDVSKTGPADAEPGATLSYSLIASNNFKDGKVANSAAFSVVLTDTKPDASTVEFVIGALDAGANATRTTSYLVPCTATDGSTLTNSVALASVDAFGTSFTASDSVTTTIHAPTLTLSKAATAAVNAGEPITYTITYENTGSGSATNVTISDTLPAGVYYSLALDTGAGPAPDSVTQNADGTTTLEWNVGDVTAASGPATIEYTARPTLLFLGGETLTNQASLTFENANGCAYETDPTSASTVITVVPPTGDPLSMGFWRTHPELWSVEFLAMFQATYQSFDGADGSTPDGALSSTELVAVMAPSGNGVRILQQQTAATLLNLASRRINAATAIDSKLARRLGLSNVRDAVIYAFGTLQQPLTKATSGRYSDATSILDSINTNKSPLY